MPCGQHLCWLPSSASLGKNKTKQNKTKQNKTKTKQNKTKQHQHLDKVTQKMISGVMITKL
jgi:F0F1-type ATP synthase assembly protein I